MRPPPKTHYLPGNHKVWTPPTVIYLDTETHVIPNSNPEILALSLWCARRIDRREVRVSEGEAIGRSGTSPVDLGGFIDLATQGRTTVWLYCHNLSFDLATTRLPLVLVSMGWAITEASVQGSSPWMRLVRGKTHLTIVDSWSWLPHPLADLAEALNMVKPALPKDPGNLAALRKRCWADVDILGAAMGSLMDWWEANELGNWTISGPSCGWNAMRHIKPLVRPTINPDPIGLAADRTAIHGGRRGAWLVGTRTQGPFVELDFKNAYPTIAAELHLPSRRMAPFQSLPLTDWRLTSPNWGVIANVLIQTEAPRYPVRFPGGTFLPSGTFRADLAGPEILDALKLGHLLGVGPGYLHQLQPHLLMWARWVLDVANDASGATPATVRLAAKAWSRSVIGKWASRGYTKVHWGPSPNAGWGYEQGFDNATQSRGAVIDLAGQRYWSHADGDAEQAYPAVLAWIESETRVRLSRVIEAIGVGAILQCDTDGLIANERLIGTAAAGGYLVAPSHLAGPARTAWVLDQLDPLTAPLTLRVKNTHKTVKVLGPQHVQAGGERSFSGLPRLATRDKEHDDERFECEGPCKVRGHYRTIPDRYTYKAWPGLSWQMGEGDPRGYVRPERKVTVAGPYAPGWITTTGLVVAPEATVDASGKTRLLGWTEMTRKPRTAKLGPVQHPYLTQLWG